MSKSSELFEKAKQLIPGGVNSPVRSFSGVGGHPVFIERAEGAYLYDVDGKAYVDYLGSWGPMILGHGHPEVKAAVHEAIEKGLSFGAVTPGEVQFAETLTRLVPNMDSVRAMNSGTEATMTAIRLARGATQRNIIIKFEGCYHGHNDSLLVKSGSGTLTFGHPSSPGIPSDTTKLTYNLTYNDLDMLKDVFKDLGSQIAGVIVEPIAANMNVVLPEAGFLEGLRTLCDEYGSLLIFDEVITGFRVAQGGAQAYFGVEADLITMGKIIGGGMPVGALGGKREIMNHLSPVGAVYQAGTLSGNPITLAAGMKTLDVIQADTSFYSRLADKTKALAEGLLAEANRAKIAMHVPYAPGLLGIYFSSRKSVSRFSDVMTSNVDQFQRFFKGMLDNGIYLAPSAYEATFVNQCHDEKTLDKTLSAARAVLSKIA